MTIPKLSILICGLAGRHKTLSKLLLTLQPQADNQPVEILISIDSGTLSIGQKRQRLLEHSIGQYACFIDDDDEVPAFYVTSILDSLQCNREATHCSLNGQLIWPNGLHQAFEHSTRHVKWETKNGMHFRPPNHLNAIRRDLALQAGFSDNNFGEDREYSEKLRDLGVLTCEAYVVPILYFYYPR